MKKEFKFEGEFYSEILDLNGKKFEHIGFRSKDGSFEELLQTLPDQVKLPIKAKLKININE